jgi:hypothetical protein
MVGPACGSEKGKKGKWNGFGCVLVCRPRKANTRFARPIDTVLFIKAGGGLASKGEYEWSFFFIWPGAADASEGE